MKVPELWSFLLLTLYPGGLDGKDSGGCCGSTRNKRVGRVSGMREEKMVTIIVKTRAREFRSPCCGEVAKGGGRWEYQQRGLRYCCCYR